MEFISIEKNTFDISCLSQENLQYFSFMIAFYVEK